MYLDLNFEHSIKFILCICDVCDYVWIWLVFRNFRAIDNPYWHLTFENENDCKSFVYSELNKLHDGVNEGTSTYRGRLYYSTNQVDYWSIQEEQIVIYESFSEAAAIKNAEAVKQASSKLSKADIEAIRNNREAFGLWFIFQISNFII